jgi:hypothetical protein
MDSDELHARLAKLRAHIPALRAEYRDDGDFMMAFAGIAEEIEEAASRADDGHDHCLQWL